MGTCGSSKNSNSQSVTSKNEMKRTGTEFTGK